MKHLLPLYGARVQAGVNAEAGQFLIEREYSVIAVDVAIGLELRGGQTYYLVGGNAAERFPHITTETGVGYLALTGYDETAGLRLRCIMSNTFETEDEKSAVLPAVLFECSAERTKKDTDGMAGELFFKIYPRKGEVQVKSNVKLAVGYYLGESANSAAASKQKTEKYAMVHMRDEVFPLRGEVRENEIRRSIFFQYGKNTDNMRFAWCMYDAQYRYRLDRKRCRYYYTKYFRSIREVEKYICAEERKLRQKREKRLRQYQISGCGKQINEILATAVNSLLGNIICICAENEEQRVLAESKPGGVYQHLQMQLYALPFYRRCCPQVLYGLMREWREWGVVTPVQNQPVLLFPDDIGAKYDIDPKIPGKANAATMIHYILHFYAVYRVTKDETFLWQQRELLHKACTFVFLDFARVQYRDLFFTIEKLEITERLPIAVLVKLQMGLQVMRELVLMLELGKINPQYIPRIERLETAVVNTLRNVFYRKRNEIPYSDISDMIYYQIMFRDPQVSDLEKAVNYIREGRKGNFCPNGKGKCYPDETRRVHDCPYSKTNRSICAEQLVLRDLILYLAGEHGIGNLTDYAAWVDAEKDKRASAHSLPELMSSFGYLEAEWRKKPKDKGE